MSLKITDWALEDRPREKLIQKGTASLSDAELLAILISSGTKNKSAVDLGRELLGIVSNNLNSLGKLTIADLKKIHGIGTARAVTIAASLELGRRRNYLKFNTCPKFEVKKMLPIFFNLYSLTFCMKSSGSCSLTGPIK